MYIQVKLALKVNDQIESFFESYESIFKSEVTRVNELFIQRQSTFEYAYKYINNQISYHSKHLILSEAKAMYAAKKAFQFQYSSYWCNSSYFITSALILETGLTTRRQQIRIPFYEDTQKQNRLSSGKPMNMKLIKRDHQWFAYILVDYTPIPSSGDVIMGIDLGIKVPAVTATSNGAVRFFGNGREIRFKQRHFRSQIQYMQRHKQFKRLRRFKHKLHYILADYDHKISKQIIDYAIQQNVGIIRLERLTGIVHSFNIDLYENIYLWSYRRLQECILYKAELNGIRVEFVNPRNTSKKCPKCGKLNYPRDRGYLCSHCSYYAHRDAIAAMNILHAL